MSFCLQSVNPQNLSALLIIFLVSSDILETERPVIWPHSLILNINFSALQIADEVLVHVLHLALNSLAGQQNNTFLPKIMAYAKFGVRYILRVRDCYAKRILIHSQNAICLFSHFHFHSICCWKVSLHLCKTQLCFLHPGCNPGISTLGLFQSSFCYRLLQLERRESAFVKNLQIWYWNMNWIIENKAKIQKSF